MLRPDPFLSRERVIRAIEFHRPDRIPISHAVLPTAFDGSSSVLYNSS